ncbi:MAG: hypothetical protein ACTSPE_10230 [Candidatus Thorarchaeota archaeon]
MMGRDSINKISELVEEEVCIDGRGLEDVGDVMFMGCHGRQCPRLSRLSGAARDPG